MDNEAEDNNRNNFRCRDNPIKHLNLDFVGEDGEIDKFKYYIGPQTKLYNILDKFGELDRHEIAYGVQKHDAKTRPRGLRWLETQDALDPLLSELYKDLVLADDENYYLVVSKLNLKNPPPVLDVSDPTRIVDTSAEERAQIGQAVYYLSDLYLDARGQLADMRRLVNLQRQPLNPRARLDSQKVNVTANLSKIAQLQELQEDWDHFQGMEDVGTKFRKSPFQRLILVFQDLKRLSFDWEINKVLKVAIESSPYFRVYAGTSATAREELKLLVYPDLPDGANTWLDRLLVQRRELWAQWRVVEDHPQTQRHKGETRVTEELEEALQVELMKLGKEYAALFALSYHGPCVAIPDTSRLGADPTSKWDARGGAFRVSRAGKTASLTDPGGLHKELGREFMQSYMVALDACGTRLSEVVPVVITEFSGRVQAAIQELQAELQTTLATDKRGGHAGGIVVGSARTLLEMDGVLGTL